jgi:homopolymeric O-antigen transport system permease protein
VLSVFASLWRWRRLVRELARRELRSRYAGSVLGALWTVLEPAVQFGLYFTVFAYFLGLRVAGRPGVSSFALYLLSGLVPFMALQESLVRATGLVRSQAALVRHVNVPLEVLLAGALLAVLVRQAVALTLVVAIAAALGSVVWSSVPMLLLGLVLLIVGSWGLALALVPAGAFLPDLNQVVGTATTVLFFATPIVYPESQIPRGLAHWIALNPLVGVLDTFRAALVGGTFHLRRTAVAAVAAAILLVAGSSLYRRRARAVRDLV